MKVLRIFFILAMFIVLVNGQSKTEEAKDKLDNPDPETQNDNADHTEIGNNHDDTFASSCTGSIFEVFIKLTMQIGLNYSFN